MVLEIFAEAFLSASLQILFDRLASSEVWSFIGGQNVSDEFLLELGMKLLVVDKVLDHAEVKQFTDERVKRWLVWVKNAVYYDAEDLRDEIATEALRRKMEAADSRTGPTHLLNSFSTWFMAPIADHQSMEFRVKKIIGKLEVLAQAIDVLALKGDGKKLPQRLPSTSLVDEFCVYGRDEIKEDMIKRLLSDNTSRNKIDVISIVGMGGAGKTTLAQLLYNDGRVKGHFHLKAWVCVSDEFCLPRVTKSILKGINSDLQSENLDLLQQKLKESLGGKKFLLVLDDVWEKCPSEGEGSRIPLQDAWQALRIPLLAAGEGSKVVVTTRNRNVAKIMRADHTHPLEGLSEAHCWSLFEELAFENGSSGAYPQLESIGRKIVAKCQGLPLAVKALGCLLYSKTDRWEWEQILESEIWDLQDHKIIPSLMLSYQDLPLHLKRCLACCSIFPKGYEFDKEKLIILWMAEGLLAFSKGNERMEKVGEQYFDELQSKSFFQKSALKESCFVMHDLIHDLAQYTSREFCIRVEDDKVQEISENTHHSLAFSGDGKKLPQRLPSTSGLGWDGAKDSDLLGHGGFHCYEISPSVGDIYGRINVRQSGPCTHSPIRSKFTDSVENFQSDSLACRTEGESYEPKGEVGYQSIKQKMEELNRMKDLVCLFLSYPMNMVNRGIHERWVLRVLKINRKVRKIEATSKKEKIISPDASKLYSEVISLLGHSMDDIEAYVPREIIEKMCQKTLGVDKTTTIHAEVQMLSDSEEEQGKKATIHREGETLSDSDVDQGNKTTIHRVSQSDSEVEQSKKTTSHSESQTLSDSEVEQGRKTTIHRESRILCDSGVDQSQKATIHRKSEALSDSEEEQGEKASSQHDEIIPVPDDILDLAVEFAIRQILKAIENPEVRRIGISGRHGIRVTSKLKNLQQVMEMFDVVVQVLASADSTINDIVEKIAAQVDRLLNDTNFLILLDYIHENINLSQLGTYWWNSKNIQKIISTTRLQKVHHKMGIDLEIRMEDHLLPWELFCVNVGKVVHSSQIQGAAVDVVKRCHGHLLAIVLMGRALKEVNDVSIWKHASHALCLCPTSQMKDSILFNALAFICKQLGSKKRCVKHCALYMDKEGMDKVHLIQRWIKDGLIGTVDEGEVIVEDLLKAFLLESSQNGVSVRMRDEIREELGNLFAPVLNLGGEGLTMPPNDVSWEEADEIHLMNNELSELPYSPNCPQLRVLLLQANPFLTVIPHLFFEHMPSLQILDLSYTRIKILPKSLFKLVKLRNFFLRSCELFMKVPPEVGELGNLEVLDFEGTEIISLPMDVGKLSKLICLKLSFYGGDEDEGKNNRSTTIIPQNAIGKLLQLEELSIDVNPDDERWNETVKNIIKEVCSLKGLKVLKLYLPEVVLLNEFKQSEISFRSLSRFSFIVGGHLKRIISRLPRETTFEFKKQKRCLKYVNGEDIPVEIKEVLQHATALFLDRHLTLTKLSEFGIENMKELEVCVLGECKEIQTLVDGAEINKQEDNVGDVNEETVLGSLRYLSIHYMKNLRSIWEGPVQKGCLSSLKSLALHTCPQLTTIFTLDLLENLNFLEGLVIENCPKINSLVTHELPAEEIQLCSIVHLPKLKKISLHYMHELVSISSGLHIAPKVEWMSFYGCPNLKTLSPMDVSSSNLKGIIGEVDWWNELTWSVQNENLDSIFVPIKGVTELMNQIAEIGDQLQH